MCISIFSHTIRATCDYSIIRRKCWHRHRSVTYFNPNANKQNGKGFPTIFFMVLVWRLLFLLVPSVCIIVFFVLLVISKCITLKKGLNWYLFFYLTGVDSAFVLCGPISFVLFAFQVHSCGWCPLSRRSGTLCRGVLCCQLKDKSNMEMAHLSKLQVFFKEHTNWWAYKDRAIFGKVKTSR